ncbi:kinase A anchor protein [Leptodontidium sp. 2 PMI_412]|nr:kinase A anchor protein [Leptodontidium sp. 2 PMI_412]
MPPKPSPPRLTHFLAIPLTTPTSRPQLHQALSLFKEKTTQPNIASLPDGIPDQAIRPLGTLHLTLGVMSLSTPEKVQGVLDLLNSLNLREVLAGVQPANIRAGDGNFLKEGGDFDPVVKENVNANIKDKGKSLSLSISLSSSSSEGQQKDANPPPIHITLRGLQSMHDPSKTSVLYTSPLDPDLRLYRFCVKLREVFGEFLVGETRPLLLHATVVNTVYVKGRTGLGGSRGRGRGGREAGGRGRLVLDARELVREWEDFVWMRDVRVERVAVLRMGAKVVEMPK